MKRCSLLALIAVGLAACESPTTSTGNSQLRTSVATDVLKTFHVTSTVDAVDARPGDGICRSAAGACTLRAAIQESRALAGEEAITLPAGVYAVTGNVLNIGGPLTITGAGAGRTAIDGGRREIRLLSIQSSGAGRVQLAHLTIRNGGNLSSGLCGQGGLAVAVGAKAVLVNVVLSGNEDYCSGGAIKNAGTLRLDRVLLIDNWANFGGGVENRETGTLDILRSTFSSNVGEDEGGAVANSGTLTMLNSTVSGNASEFGVGGIQNYGEATLNNVTITANEGSHAGGLANGGFFGTEGVVRLSNTILAGNTEAGYPPDCAGTLTSRGYNLIGSVQGGCTIAGDRTGNKVGVNPRLGPLQNNGGPTPTHALLARSPARNAANPARPGSGYPACPPLDQRLLRRTDTRCDIGAFEVQSP